MKDHLGNVRVVLKDWKLNPGNDGIPPFTAQPEEVFNYYTFGMLIPGFFSNATPEYRFGFNGMLRDDDVRDKNAQIQAEEGLGNSYDFGARVYDPRKIIFLSLDPLKAKFPSQSSYVFAGNNPISFIDEDGNDARYFNIVYQNTGDFYIKLVKWEDNNSWQNFFQYDIDIYNLNGKTYSFGADNVVFGHYGVNSRKYLDEFLQDPIGTIEKYNWKSDEIMLNKGLDQAYDILDNTLENAIMKSAKKVPNPNGSKGKPDHQAKVEELVHKAKSELKSGESVAKPGTKMKESSRRPDVRIIDEKNNTKKIYEAERKPNSKRNKKREKEYNDLKIPNETHKVGGN